MTNQRQLDYNSKEKLERYILQKMKNERLPAVSICLFVGDQTVYARGFGSASIEPPRSATPDTLYGVGSVTKAFTSIVVLKLYEEGKISLEDPVNKYIPSFNADRNTKPVTIHQLLTHTSGFPNLGSAEEIIGKMSDAPTSWIPLGSFDDLLNLINSASEERLSDEGDVFFYWNEGYALLGEIIQRVSGKKYTTYVTENILKPLGMSRSSFDRSVLDKDPDAMTGYLLTEKGGRKPQKFPAHPLVDAAGGLITSVSELSRFVSMCINKGVYKGNRVINRETLEKAFTPFVKHTLPSNLVGGDYYGYGFIINQNFQGYTLIGHGGNIGVSSAYFGFIPELSLGVTVACNSESPATLLGLYALCVLTGIDPESALPEVAFEKMCSKLTGKYATFNGVHKAIVTKDGPNLFLKLMEGETPSLSLPLVFEGNKAYLLWGSGKLEVKIVQSKGKTQLYVERNVYHKIEADSV
jgi:CubicO group peptidase (beta-lactamase class C family)